MNSILQSRQTSAKWAMIPRSAKLSTKLSNSRKPVTRLVRERIDASALQKRLQLHAIGEIEMSQTQIRAAEILLRKCIPDLKAIEHSTDDKGITVKLVSHLGIEAPINHS